MNYHSFRLAVQQEWAEADDQRLGQVYFNLLHNLRPDIANRLRGSLIDPFYRDKLSTETEEFVIAEWDDDTEFPVK